MGIPADQDMILDQEEDDLELYKKAFDEDRIDPEAFDEEREFDYEWIIVGDDQDKENLLKFYQEEVAPWRDHMDLRANLSVLYPDDHRRCMNGNIKIMMNSYWQSLLCPFGLLPNRERILDFAVVRYDEDFLERETLLVACEWLSVFVENFFKRFNLKLSGYIDNSHRRYVVVDNTIMIQPSCHYASTIRSIFKD